MSRVASLVAFHEGRESHAVGRHTGRPLRHLAPRRLRPACGRKVFKSTFTARRSPGWMSSTSRISIRPNTCSACRSPMEPDDWQLKFGYAHLSSHLGDELVMRDPAALDERVNYVRDAFVFGTSYYLHPMWRKYGEVGWAFHNSGGAQPWERSSGRSFSARADGPAGSPFFAVNGRMREEHDFGGDVTVQAGWLRRGGFGQTMRVAAHYYNGKSSQFQFFDQAEEQIGLGLWYDF